MSRLTVETLVDVLDVKGGGGCSIMDTSVALRFEMADDRNKGTALCVCIGMSSVVSKNNNQLS